MISMQGSFLVQNENFWKDENRKGKYVPTSLSFVTRPAMSKNGKNCCVPSTYIIVLNDPLFCEYWTFPASIKKKLKWTLGTKLCRIACTLFQKATSNFSGSANSVENEYRNKIGICVAYQPRAQWCARTWCVGNSIFWRWIVCALNLYAMWEFTIYFLTPIFIWI